MRIKSKLTGAEQDIDQQTWELFAEKGLQRNFRVIEREDHEKLFDPKELKEPGLVKPPVIKEFKDNSGALKKQTNKKE